MRVIGVDLAWGEGSDARPANETGLVAVDPDGTVVDAGWSRGLEVTRAWIRTRTASDTLVVVDAPLVVPNLTGQRRCETQAGQRYGRWKVAANSTNLRTTHLAGVRLLNMLMEARWAYHDGTSGPPLGGRHVIEGFPYTTLVGASELGYPDARPIYKRPPRRLVAADFAGPRALICDDLIRRLNGLRDADPPLDLRSHPTTRTLIEEPSPLASRAYKHREDLLDAAICAWTGRLWLRWGLLRCQILGADDPTCPRPTILAPARPEQRGPESRFHVK